MQAEGPGARRLRAGGLMRAMFFTYLTVIVVTISYFVAIGALGR